MLLVANADANNLSAFNVADPVQIAQWYTTHLGLRVVRRVDGPTHTHFLADSAGIADSYGISDRVSYLIGDFLPIWRPHRKSVLCAIEGKAGTSAARQVHVLPGEGGYVPEPLSGVQPEKN